MRVGPCLQWICRKGEISRFSGPRGVGGGVLISSISALIKRLLHSDTVHNVSHALIYLTMLSLGLLLRICGENSGFKSYIISQSAADTSLPINQSAQSSTVYATSTRFTVLRTKVLGRFLRKKYKTLAPICKIYINFMPYRVHKRDLRAVFWLETWHISRVPSRV